MIKVEGLTKTYGALHGRRRRQLRLPARAGHRLPRPQRRRQDDHDADHGRAHPGHPRPGHDRRPRTTTTSPTRAATSACCSTPRPSTPAAPAARCSPSAPSTMGLPDVARRRDARRWSRSTHDRGQAPGAQLLARHAAAARHRARAARRPVGADPRRAGQRPRPGRHPLDARPAQGVRRPRRHRAALQPPAPRGRADRRRDDPDRPRQDRGPAAPRPSCSPAPATRPRS